MHTSWYALASRQWPYLFWFGVAADVKDEGIKRNKLEEVKRIVQRHERSQKWQRYLRLTSKPNFGWQYIPMRLSRTQRRRVSLEDGLLYVLRR
jgi:hypothetical protein